MPPHFGPLMRERVAEMLKQGLEQQEAFKAAVRQVGSPGELAPEFARENPFAVWRERLFWMALAGFAISVWGLLTNGLILWFVNSYRALVPTFPSTAFHFLAGQMPVLIVLVLLATGRLQSVVQRFEKCIQSRERLGFTGPILLFLSILWFLFGPSSMGRSLPKSPLLTQKLDRRFRRRPFDFVDPQHERTALIGLLHGTKNQVRRADISACCSATRYTMMPRP